MSDEPVPAGQHTPPPEAIEAAEAQAAEAQSCEHWYASKHQPGHSIYWVRQCMVCHEIDWDDLDRQIEQFGAEVPLVPGAQVTTEALAAFKAARPSMTAAIRAAQRRADEQEFATRNDTWQQAMAATNRKAVAEARAEERERILGAFDHPERFIGERKPRQPTLVWRLLGMLNAIRTAPDADLLGGAS